MRHRLQVAVAVGAGLLGAVVASAAGPKVTIYSQDLAFVRETRAIELRRDRDTVAVPIPETVDFSSVRLSGAGLRVSRLAYRYDVASGDAALERARGSQVRVHLREDRIVEGTLIAVDGSWLLVRGSDGTLHTLSRTAVEDARIPAVGDRLALRPELEAVVEGRRGTVNADLAYLARGLSWAAEHTLVRKGESGATWSTQVAITNQSGRTFEDATVKLVAGEPNRETAKFGGMAGRVMAVEMAAAPQADMVEQAFSEYHLYALSRPATLRHQESQSLAMLDPRDIQVTPVYRYRGGDARGVRLQLEALNTDARGLGVALPGGRVRIYETDAAGDVQFAGESSIRHTAEGEKFTLEVGSAFDLVAERREVFNRRLSDREREYQVEIQLRNRKKAAVDIVVEEGLGGDSEITQKTHEFTRKDANTLEFRIPVAAGKETVLRYTARVRY